MEGGDFHFEGSSKLSKLTPGKYRFEVIFYISPEAEVSYLK